MNLSLIRLKSFLQPQGDDSHQGYLGNDFHSFIFYQLHEFVIKAKYQPYMVAKG